jgi:hypothetical protein
MHLIMGYGFYKYYYGARELKYVPCPCLVGVSRNGCSSTADISEATLPIYHIQIFQQNYILTNPVLLHSELAREKMWSRIHLTPLLQAEEDRDQVRRHYADQAREKELLGTETRVYHSDRYVEYRP